MPLETRASLVSQFCTIPTYWPIEANRLATISTCGASEVAVHLPIRVRIVGEVTLQDKLTGCHMVLLWSCVKAKLPVKNFVNFGVSLNLVNKCSPHLLNISVTHQIGWSSEVTRWDKLTGCYIVLLRMPCLNQTKPLISMPFQSILHWTKFSLLFCRYLYSVLLLTLQSSLS